MVDIQRQPAHSPSCWHWHPTCARERLASLQNRLASLRNKLWYEKEEIEHPITCHYFEHTLEDTLCEVDACLNLVGDDLADDSNTKHKS